MWLQNHEDYGHLVVNPIDKISFNSSFMSQVKPQNKFLKNVFIPSLLTIFILNYFRTYINRQRTGMFRKCLNKILFLIFEICLLLNKLLNNYAVSIFSLTPGYNIQLSDSLNIL